MEININTTPSLNQSLNVPTIAIIDHSKITSITNQQHNNCLEFVKIKIRMLVTRAFEGSSPIESCFSKMTDLPNVLMIGFFGPNNIQVIFEVLNHIEKHKTILTSEECNSSFLTEHIQDRLFYNVIVSLRDYFEHVINGEEQVSSFACIVEPKFVNLIPHISLKALAINIPIEPYHKDIAKPSLEFKNYFLGSKLCYSLNFKKLLNEINFWKEEENIEVGIDKLYQLLTTYDSATTMTLTQSQITPALTEDKKSVFGCF